MTFERMLVDIDAGAVAQPALEAAVALARRSGGRIRVVDVVSAATEPAGGGARALDALRRARERRLAGWAGPFRDVVTSIDVLIGPRADTLLEDVRRSGQDLVIRSAPAELAERRTEVREGPGAGLCRRCPCPVWTVGQVPMPLHARIAAAVDVGDGEPLELAERVVETALAFATIFDGSLTLVHAGQSNVGRRIAAGPRDDSYANGRTTSRNQAMRTLAALADRCHDAGVTRRLEVRHGAAREVLPEFVLSQGIHLIVAGAAGSSGLADGLRDRIACSVVAVTSDHSEAAAVRSALPSGWPRAGSQRA